MKKRYRARNGCEAPEPTLGLSALLSLFFIPARRLHLPRKQPGRHCQCGARSNTSAVVGIFSASIVNSAGNIAQATLPKWRFLQIFRPRRLLSLCVVNLPRKMTVAAPRASLFFRLRGHFYWMGTQRRRHRSATSLNFFADVSFFTPRGRFWRPKNQGDCAEMATSLNYFAASVPRPT